MEQDRTVYPSDFKGEEPPERRVREQIAQALNWVMLAAEAEGEQPEDQVSPAYDMWRKAGDLLRAAALGCNVAAGEHMERYRRRMRAAGKGSALAAGGGGEGTSSPPSPTDTAG